MSGEGGPIPQIKWHTGTAVLPDGTVIDWTPGETRYWHPQRVVLEPGYVSRFDDWGDWISGFDPVAFAAWEAKQRTWQYRLRRKLSGWWNLIDAIWPCEISQWIARQLRRYADWIDERSWYI